MEVPILINRIFAGLFLLFAIPGRQKPKNNHKMADRARELMGKLLSKSPNHSREILERAQIVLLSTIKNPPTLDPGPTIGDCCSLAREHGLQVIEEEYSATISGLTINMEMVLKINYDVMQEGKWSVTLQVFDPKSNVTYVEVCYWQPPECPVLVCRPYLHPLVENQTASYQIKLLLEKEIDREYGCDAIFQQATSWNWSK